MSVIRVDNFGPSAGGTTYSARGIAKAFVNFNGTGTIAARDSENVSSLTDNGTGDYTVNFTTAMDNANYSAVGTIGDNPSELRTRVFTVSSVRAQAFNSPGAATDALFACFSIDGDLA